MQVYDVHHHFGALGTLKMTTPFDELVDNHINMMKTNDISGAVIMPPPTYANPDGIADTREINNTIAKVKQNYPDWFPAGLGTVEPSYGDVALDEIERILTELDLDGLMWHNRWQKAFADADIMFKLIEHVAEFDGIVLLHAISESAINAPWRVFKVVREFPDVNFVIVDALSAPHQSIYIRQHAGEFENAVFDTGLATSLRRQVKDFSEQVGADQLVVGTDFYSNLDVNQVGEIDEIKHANITDAEKESILHKNFERVFLD